MSWNVPGAGPCLGNCSKKERLEGDGVGSKSAGLSALWDFDVGRHRLPSTID